MSTILETLYDPKEAEKVGKEYSLWGLRQAQREPDEEDPDYFICDCGERLDFGIASVPNAMCDKGHIWYQGEDGKWTRVSLAKGG